MACIGKSNDRKKILKVLKDLPKENPTANCNKKMPSQAAQFVGSDFRYGTREKIEAVDKSFSSKELIDVLPEKRETEKAAQATTSTRKKRIPTSSPQKEGIDLHKELADQINKRSARKGTAEKMLKAIENQFACKFLKAEVRICGYATRKSKVDFYSGDMDAVAIRGDKDNLEVIVVDWKTTSKDLTDLTVWWNEASNFKAPLYQCLLYRELLQMHLKLHKINAKVGIMLVPFHQSQPELLMPRLCMDVREMEKEGLLEDLKKYEWFPNESSCVHAIKPTSKLFNLESSDSVDESTNLLKEDTLLKDIIRGDATIADLRQEFGLLKSKVTGNDEKLKELLPKTTPHCDSSEETVRELQVPARMSQRRRRSRYKI